MLKTNCSPQSIKGLSRDAWRFALLSGGCWLFDTSVLLLLTNELLLQPMTANVVSSLAAAAIVYTISHHHIHGGIDDWRGLRLAAYIIYTLVVILIASFLLGQLQIWFGGFLNNAAVITLAAKIAITPPQLVCNFLVSRFVARARYT